MVDGAGRRQLLASWLKSYQRKHRHFTVLQKITRSPSFLLLSLKPKVTAKLYLVLVMIGAFTGVVRAQESPTPITSVTPTLTPSPALTASPTRSIRIRFVPPPLDGTISLGIYDSSGKLVRVLRQQAPLDSFNIGADALETTWDGKDDDGQDLPPGKYKAHGYAVGSIQVTPNDSDSDAPPPSSNDMIAIKLMSNPLVKNDRPTVQLSVGFDDTDSYLKTMDELPLYVISERSEITSVVVTKSGDKSMEVWQESGAGTEHLRISKLDQMMAFDCGVFDLK
jgi:FlgD Ig-like domain